MKPLKNKISAHFVSDFSSKIISLLFLSCRWLEGHLVLDQVLPHSLPCEALQRHQYLAALDGCLSRHLSLHLAGSLFPVSSSKCNRYSRCSNNLEQCLRLHRMFLTTHYSFNSKVQL